MCEVVLTVPEETLVALKIRRADLGAEVRLAAAVKLYELGRLSSGAAATLADLPRTVFLARILGYARRRAIGNIERGGEGLSLWRVSSSGGRSAICECFYASAASRHSAIAGESRSGGRVICTTSPCARCCQPSTRPSPARSTHATPRHTRSTRASRARTRTPSRSTRASRTQTRTRSGPIPRASGPDAHAFPLDPRIARADAHAFPLDPRIA